MDPLEWLARLSDHVPAPGQHRTLFYGEYSNRLRGCGEPADHLGLSTPEVDKPPPPLPEILRVAEQGGGWGVPAGWE
jgi:hypothetical protein